MKPTESELRILVRAAKDSTSKKYAEEAAAVLLKYRLPQDGTWLFNITLERLLAEALEERLLPEKV